MELHIFHTHIFHTHIDFISGGMHLGNSLGQLLDWPSHGLLIAQQFKDTLGEDIAKVWNNFIKSGQVWALLIGTIVGYMLRSLTAY
jgi:hypothetical protein